VQTLKPSERSDWLDEPFEVSTEMAAAALTGIDKHPPIPWQHDPAGGPLGHG